MDYLAMQCYQNYCATKLFIFYMFVERAHPNGSAEGNRETQSVIATTPAGCHLVDIKFTDRHVVIFVLASTAPMDDSRG